MDVLNIIGRKYPLFSEDLAHYEEELTSLTQDNSFHEELPSQLPEQLMTQNYF